jgi:hypothetical protein
MELSSYVLPPSSGPKFKSGKKSVGSRHVVPKRRMIFSELHISGDSTRPIHWCAILLETIRTYILLSSSEK